MTSRNVKDSWSKYTGKAPGIMLDVTALQQDIFAQHTAPAEKQRPSAVFAMTQPWNYSF